MTNFLEGSDQGRFKVTDVTIFLFKEEELVPGNLSEPIGQAIARLQAPLTALLDLDESRKVMINFVRWRWQVCHHLLYKEFLNPKHKVPAKKALREHLESQTNWVKALYRLAERTHALQGSLNTRLLNPETGQPYSDAGQLFELLMVEIETWSLESLLPGKGPDIHRELPSHKRPSWKEGEAYRKQPLMGPKEAAILKQRKLRDYLKNFRNPFNPETQPHEFAFISAALELAARFPAFQKERWKPMVAAYAVFVRDMDRGKWGLLEEVNGRVVIRHGRGRNAYVKSF